MARRNKESTRKAFDYAEAILELEARRETANSVIEDARRFIERQLDAEELEYTAAELQAHPERALSILEQYDRAQREEAEA